MASKTELLSAADSRTLDALAKAQGISEAQLIKNAGRRAAQIIARLYSPCRVHILCGTGNNGADGLTAAHNLHQMGFDCRPFLLGENAHAHLWRGKTYPLEGSKHDEAQLVIDALFGTGLSRGLSPQLLALSQTIEQEVVALDMPSGFNSDDGSGAGFHATHTISFVRAHVGHYLLPAKAHCGEIHIADIGIGDELVERLAVRVRLNSYRPLPPPRLDGHKYQRGMVVVVGGSEKRGAAQLAALAALRVGAGLVVVNEPEPTALADNSLMTESISLQESLKDARRNVVVLGCGNGVDRRTRDNVLLALSRSVDCVLDADALTCFQDDSALLFDAIQNKPSGAVVLTPHEGEFARLFKVEGSKLVRAREAARLSGAIVLLKGNDSVIASPQGEVIINDRASAHLAKAGTGDVLAGLIGGILAQRLEATPLEMIAQAVFIHGLLGERAGAHLLASDLPNLIPILYNDIGG